MGRIHHARIRSGAEAADLLPHQRRQPQHDEQRRHVRDEGVLQQVHEQEVARGDRLERRVERGRDQEEAGAEGDDAPRRRPIGARRAPVERGGGDGEREEERLEAERGRAHVHVASGQASPAPAGPQQQRDARPEREELLDHHHDPRQLLVGHRRDPVRAAVRRIERGEGEDEDVREDLPGREHRRRERDAAADAQPAVRARVDEERPDEDPGEHPADVLEVVEQLMLGGLVVEVGDVPDREVRRPEAERDARP